MSKSKNESGSGKPVERKMNAYKASGRREINKKLKAKRHEKRMQAQLKRVMERYEAGKPLSKRTMLRCASRIAG